MTSGDERGVFAMSAFCAWVRDYKNAKQSGNLSEASIASHEIADVRSWPAVRADQKFRKNNMLHGFFVPFQRAVATGSVTQVARELARPHNQCSSFMPTPRDQPALTDGGRVKK